MSAFPLMHVRTIHWHTNEMLNCHFVLYISGQRSARSWHSRVNRFIIYAMSRTFTTCRNQLRLSISKTNEFVAEYNVANVSEMKQQTLKWCTNGQSKSTKDLSAKCEKWLQCHWPLQHMSLQEYYRSNTRLRHILKCLNVFALGFVPLLCAALYLPITALRAHDSSASSSRCQHSAKSSVATANSIWTPQRDLCCLCCHSGRTPSAKDLIFHISSAAKTIIFYYIHFSLLIKIILCCIFPHTA